MADQRALNDPNRVPALIVQDSTGAETRQIRSTAGNPNAVPVDIVGGTVSVGSIDSITTSVTPGTAATNLGKAEDAAHTSGDVGVFALGVRNSTNASLTSADGDYSPIATDSAGRVGIAPAGLTGSTVPTSAIYLGIRAASSNLAGLSVPSTTLNSTLSAGEGLTVALAAQLDDVTPTTITENSFGNLRMTSARALMTEQVYSYGRATADTQIKSSGGFIHTITIAPTGSVTAGVLTIYDSAAESGTVIFSVSLPTTTFTPFSVQLNVTTATGIYVGFDGTLANVQATLSYR